MFIYKYNLHDSIKQPYHNFSDKGLQNKPKLLDQPKSMHDLEKGRQAFIKQGIPTTKKTFK